MIDVADLLLQFDGKPIFKDVNFLINKGDRIGLIGKNGAGKTTLLRILTGLQPYDEGSINHPKNFKIGYLPQELEVTSTETIFQETRKALVEVTELEKELEQLEKEVQERTDYQSDNYQQLIQRLYDQQEAFRLKGGYDADGQVERILKGLGFLPSDFSRPLQELSGGWKMRVELAKLLLKNPDLLLLDEPTNHLDIESITWLESFLKDLTGALVLVSHDRTFLDNITNRTFELVKGRVDDYKANFSKFLELREESREQQRAAKEQQDEEIARMERNIERFRGKPNKASFAKSLMKKLEKIERVEVDQDDHSSINITFPKSRREGQVVVAGTDVSKNFDENQVIEGLNFEIVRGDRVAFVGKNGMGKSTLSRIISGNMDYDGTLNFGHNLDLGFFDQHEHKNLQQELTILEEMESAASNEMRPKVRGILGAFLFSGNDVFKKVKVLSGGEKARLALAKMLLEPINFLILDEPTNHLDMVSKEVLKNALLQFKGTMIIVSHDRHFMQGLTNKVFEFNEYGIQIYPGDINTYLNNRQLKDFRQLEQEKTTTDQPAQQEQAISKQQQKAQFEEKKNLEKVIRKQENHVKKLERSIESIEKELTTMEDQLQNPSQYKIDVNDPSFYKSYNGKKEELANAEKDWEKAVEALDQYKSEIEAYKIGKT